MLYYRLYFLNAVKGHLERFAEFQARDDVAASALAGEYEGVHALELCCLHRKVMRFAAVF